MIGPKFRLWYFTLLELCSMCTDQSLVTLPIYLQKDHHIWPAAVDWVPKAHCRGNPGRIRNAMIDTYGCGRILQEIKIRNQFPPECNFYLDEVISSMTSEDQSIRETMSPGLAKSHLLSIFRKDKNPKICSMLFDF